MFQDERNDSQKDEAGDVNFAVLKYSAFGSFENDVADTYCFWVTLGAHFLTAYDGTFRNVTFILAP